MLLLIGIVLVLLALVMIAIPAIAIKLGHTVGNRWANVTLNRATLRTWTTELESLRVERIEISLTDLEPLAREE